MPRKLTVRFECDRCSRQWFEDYEEGEDLPDADSITLEMVSGDKTIGVGFETLCESCSKSISNLVASIGKTMKSKSPTRAEAKKDSPVKEEPIERKKSQAAASA